MKAILVGAGTGESATPHLTISKGAQRFWGYQLPNFTHKWWRFYGTVLLHEGLPLIGGKEKLQSVTTYS